MGAQVKRGKHLENSPEFEHWAKLQNLKEMAKTLLYLQENGLDDYAVLEKA
ncbi:MAG: hypothetical protein RR933_01715 [Oscillospiraceae bacterium]